MQVLAKMLLQVLTVKQAARWTVQVGREHNQLLDFIAAQNGFPSHEEIIANIDDARFSNDWKRFWQYTDSIDPYVSTHTGYVPIDKSQYPAKSMPVTLY